MSKTKKSSLLSGLPDAEKTDELLFRVIEDVPHTFRLVRYPDGELRLQGAYAMQTGFGKGVFIWRDMPVVDVDEHGRAKNRAVQ